MFSSKLPPPIDLSSLTNRKLEDIIEYVYQNHFKNEFMSKEVREKLFGRFIYLDIKFLDYKPEKFWHIITFKPEEEKYTVDPCINAEDLLICKDAKPGCYTCFCVPKTPELQDRCECIYRLRRINWINSIIRLANQEDQSIKIWYEDDKDEKNKPFRKAFIRFEDGLADYLIVLVDYAIKGDMSYKFLTAYPVVHKGTKQRLKQSFENCQRFYKKQKSGLNNAESGSLFLHHGR